MLFMSKLNTIFQKYPNIEGSLIAILQDIQELYSYLSEDVLTQIAEHYKISLSEIYGVATFYSQFKLNKPGKHQIKVCHGTACHINGAVSISETIEDFLHIKNKETTPDGKFSLEKVACLGCCSLAPVVMIDEKVHGNLDAKKIKKILKEIE